MSERSIVNMQELNTLSEIVRLVALHDAAEAKGYGYEPKREGAGLVGAVPSPHPELHEAYYLITNWKGESRTVYENQVQVRLQQLEITETRWM